MEKTKARESNIELLRIVTMVMIIAHHYSIYSGMNMKLSNNLGFSVISEILRYGGSLGVNIFLLITGYFLIDKQFTSKRIIKIWLETLFYTLLLLLIVKIPKYNNLTTGNKLLYFIPIMSNQYWFITNYLLLSIISPFINILLKSITKISYQRLLFLFILFVIPMFLFDGKSTYISGNIFGELFISIYIYAIGGYIKLYGIKVLSECKELKLILILIAIYILLFNIIILVNYEGLNYYYFTNMDNPIIIIMSILYFYIFRKIKMKNNIFINCLSSITLGVYLVHEHPIMKKVLWLNWFNSTDSNLSRYVILFILAELTIYAITIVIEIIRKNILEKPLFDTKFVNKICSKIDSFYLIENKN